MYRSIVVSCDTYYYVLASETDIDDTARFMTQLGFGQKTGVDIEGELTGVLPSREWKRTRFAGEKYREEHRKWYLGDSISAGIGQGYNAFTPMQLAHAIAIVANDGVAYRPHLVKNIVNLKSGEERVGRAGADAHHLVEARAHRLHQERARRREQGRHQRRGLRGREVHVGRQDRNRAGVLAQGREVRGAQGRRTAARPRVVRRVRARPTSPRSRSRCWWRTAASARRPRRPSRARCSTISCSGSTEPGPAIVAPTREGEDESD